MSSVQAISKIKPVNKKEAIPAYLIRDVIDGVPYYYKGYRDVLNKTKTFQDIMPSSTLQSEIIMYLNYLLTQALGIEDFRIYASESGNHLAKRVNYGLDLSVYDTRVLSSEKVNEKYADVPPVLVVEVDVKVDTGNLTEDEFILKKTQSLLDYGVSKVIWVISMNKKVLIAEKGKDWLVRDWQKEFELMQGIRANIGAYLKKRGVPAGK